MLLLILLSALALWGVVSTVLAVRRDGYRARATDWTRVAEHGSDALQRAESTIGYR